MYPIYSEQIQHHHLKELFLGPEVHSHFIFAEHHTLA